MARKYVKGMLGQGHEYKLLDDISSEWMFRGQSNVIVQRAIMFTELEQDEDVNRVMPFIQQLMKYRRLRSQRKACALKLYEVMKIWSNVGVFMMSMKRFHHRIRRIQRFWRTVRARLHNYEDIAFNHFRSIEEARIRQDIADFKVPRVMTLTLEERIESLQVIEPMVREFLRHELRYRRYNLIPRINYWTDDYYHYLEDVKQWRIMKVAYQTFNVDANQSGPPPNFPPAPTHLPNDKEMQDIVKRCTANKMSFTRITDSAKPMVTKRSSIDSDE